MDAVTVHIEALTAHTAAVTAHIEAATAHTATATSHTSLGTIKTLSILPRVPMKKWRSHLSRGVYSLGSTCYIIETGVPKMSKTVLFESETG